MRRYVAVAVLLLLVAWQALPGPSMDGAPLYGPGVSWRFVVQTAGPAVALVVAALLLLGLGAWRRRHG